MTEYAGRGDPKRLLALLWRRLPLATRGRKPGLELDDIIAAAIRIADASGLATVSMRTVARALDISTMALYTYVPGKHELLDLMSDHVLGELKVDRTHDHWRAAIEASVRDVWSLYERHPWLMHISSARASLGPHTFDVYEAQCRMLDGLGLSGAEISRLVNVLLGYVRGAVRDVADARAAARETGMTDDEWWAGWSVILEELASEPGWAIRFPMIVRLDREHAFDQSDRAPGDTTTYMEREALDAFELGLACILDGIEALVARKRARASGPP